MLAQARTGVTINPNRPNKPLTIPKILLVAAALLAVASRPGVAATYVGNNFIFTPGLNPDGDPPLVILGEYNSAGPLSGPASTVLFPSAGTVTDVKFYGDAYEFTLYALSWVSGVNNEQTFQVEASEGFAGGDSSTTLAYTLPVTGFDVGTGELLAFAGIGPYYECCDSGYIDVNGQDATYEDGGGVDDYTATAPSGAIGTPITVGINSDPNAEYVALPNADPGRYYDIGVDVNVAAPEPAALPLLTAGLLALLPLRRRRGMAGKS